MALPPITLSSDSIEDLNLDALTTPLVDAFDKSDDPCSDARDRSTSPTSDAAETPVTKEWLFFSLENFVQHLLKSNYAADIVANEAVIMKYHRYKKDYELVKPILDTLIRFSVDNHENAHEMAHGILNDLYLGRPLLTLNPAWVKHEKERAAAAVAAKAEEERRKAEEERKKAEEEREKAESDAKARAKGAVDLLAKVDFTIAKAKAEAESRSAGTLKPAIDKCQSKGKGKSSTQRSAATAASDSACDFSDKETGEKAAKTDGVADDKKSDDNSQVEDTPKAKKKFVRYVPKYLLDVHHRKYCMNDALVTRSSVGDPSIVSCLAASARKAHTRIVARNSKSVCPGARTPLLDCYPATWDTNGKWEKGEGDQAVVVTAEGVVGDLKNIEGSYPDDIDGLIAEVIEAMLWM